MHRGDVQPSGMCVRSVERQVIGKENVGIEDDKETINRQTDIAVLLAADVDAAANAVMVATLQKHWC